MECKGDLSYLIVNADAKPAVYVVGISEPFGGHQHQMEIVHGRGVARILGKGGLNNQSNARA